MNINRSSIDAQRVSHLRLITQKTRSKMLCLIRGHPQELPSLVELDIVLDEHKSTLYEHMRLLIDAGLVTRYVGESEDDGSKSPYVFYGLTETGYELVETTTVFPNAAVLKDDYQRLIAGTAAEEYTELDRPHEAVDTVMDLNAIDRGSE